MWSFYFKRAEIIKNLAFQMPGSDFCMFVVWPCPFRNAQNLMSDQIVEKSCVF